MPQVQTIQPDSPEFPQWLNFDFLRQEGLKHIGALSGQVWTDHNTHDPGITVLEVLCYVLTDLGYRNRFNIEDIIARLPQDINRIPFKDIDDNFFSPAEILSVNPLTVDDYRKMLLDIVGVRNVWLKKAESQEVPLFIHKKNNPTKGESDYELNTAETSQSEPLLIKGLYDVLIDLEDATPQYSGNLNKAVKLAQDQMVETVRKRLNAHRNLCEDFHTIEVMEIENVSMCMEIDLSADAVPQDVFVDIFEAVQKFLTPTIRFYTLQEMLEKQKTIDTIFAGRPFDTESHGFIDDAELATLTPKSEIHVSDLYNIILNLKGVRAIRFLQVLSDSKPEGDLWCVPLNSDKSPRLSINGSSFLYSKGQLPIEFTQADKDEVAKKLDQKLANYYKRQRSPYELGFETPQGRYDDFGDYSTIQNEFPAIYAIGEGQLPQADGVKRLYNALQLKGYLAFFDQLMANYLAQLAHIRTVFALRPAKVPVATYFNQIVQTMPDAALVLKHYGNAEITIGAATAQDFYYNQTLATFQQTFESPELRDDTMAAFQKAFEENSLQRLIIDRWDIDPTLPECDRFFYFFKIGENTGVVQSEAFFKSKQAVEQHIEIVKNVGLIPEAYRRIDNDKNADGVSSFSFAIVYSPLDFKDYLGRIVESPKVFYQRREGFLNHLLARFAEQFTEYTLLMYALEGKAKEQKEIVEDKARFLSNYADISRNRSKAFDYTDKDSLWNTNNVSGLEMRVAGYLGIDNWQRRTLNYFKLATTDEVKVFTLKETLFGNTIWTSPFLKRDSTNSPCLADFKTGRFEKIGCDTEGGYSFQYTDDNGTTFTHPQLYSTPQERDEAFLFWQTFFKDNKPVVESREIKEKFIFILKNKADNTVLLESTTTYPTSDAAEMALFKTIQFAFSENNYQHTEKPPFYFTIVDDKATLIAESPARSDSKGQSLEAADYLMQHIKATWHRFAVKKADSYVTWRIADAVGNPLFEGILKFKKYDDAATQSNNRQPYQAYHEALLLMRQDNALFVDLDSATQQYHVFLRYTDTPNRLFLDWDFAQNWLFVGRSYVSFKTKHEAKAALLNLRSALKAENLIEQSITRLSDGKYSFRLIFPDDGYPIMVSQDAYASRAEALKAFSDFIHLAIDKLKYIKINQADKNAFRIDEGNVHARSANVYVTEEIRDDAIEDIIRKVTQYKAALTFLDETAAPYFIEILSPENTLWLTSAARYDTEQAAYSDLKFLFEAFNAGLKPTEEQLSDGNKLYGIQLEKEGNIIAFHPETYMKQPMRDKVLAEMGKLVKNTEGGVLPDVKHRFVVKYANNFLQIKDLLIGEELFETAEQAISTGQSYITNLKQQCVTTALSKTTKTKSTQEVLPTNDTALIAKSNQISFNLCSNKAVLARYPLSFKTNTDAEAFAAKMYDYLTNSPICEEKNAEIPAQIDVPKNCLAMGTRYRLRDDAAIVARFAKSFKDETDCANALTDFWEAWHKGTKAFPEIKRVGTERVTVAAGGVTNEQACQPCQSTNQDAMVLVERGVFTFTLVCGVAACKFYSGKNYSLGDEAEKENLPKLLDFIKLIADIHAYEIERVESKYRLAFYDYTKLMKEGATATVDIAVADLFDTEEAAWYARKDLTAWAKTFPISQDKDTGAYSFRLFQQKPPVSDEEEGEIVLIWHSTDTYDSREAAQQGFHYFLRLLSYPANVMRLENPITCVLGEIMLEVNNEYKKVERAECNETFKVIGADQVWKTDLNLLLKNINQAGRVIVTDAGIKEGGCAYNFRVVDDRYRVAEHPIPYYNAIQKSRAKTQLWQLAKAEDSSSIKVDLGKASLTVSFEMPDKSIVVWSIIDFTPEPSYWTLSTETNERATILNQQLIAFYYFLLWAEHPEFYEKDVIYEKINDKTVKKYILRLVDEDNKEVAAAQFDTETERDNALTESLNQARDYPIKPIRPTRKGEPLMFRFRIYARQWQDVTTQEAPKGAYIWQGVHLRPTDKEALADFDQWKQAVTHHENFETVREDSCSSFGIELVDKQNIIAYYPGVYPSYETAHAGAMQMLDLVNQEGFHLVEHVLLRPKTPQDTLLALDPLMTQFWDKVKFPEYEPIREELPGGDSYSAQITVILPYWCKRFQTEKFREFFQNTLRRELPAHCLLSAYWVTPQDMCAFEDRYQKWLQAKAQNTAFKDLATLLSVQNIYADALLSDDSVGYGAFLDNIALS